ncbi:hypothetical protein N7481_010193 [Penicillium waksmanii]|uniref:uncharacterized protein n=1 Tax=Penicillium waksmanii TaxID=69791 RepID=UPI0025479FA7|nr:uncharacterized protein N7481_010193 [Penicillium waksmanii]KAJ5976486.1 hypothetical protein N7481_010193 [Penicillium waksmanii]
MPSVIQPAGVGTHVAIVGAGPRGTSTLERLCASAPEFLAPGARLTVHIIDPSPPGAGRVWRTEQSNEVLMNTVTSQVTLFTDDSIVCSGPIRPGPSLYNWAADRIPGLGPDDYGTRAQYGQYLEWIFQEIVRQAPPQVQIEVHPAFAVRLDDTSYGQQTLTLSNGRTLSGLAAVVLAQGHVPLLLDIEQRKLNAYAELNGLHHITPSNPADVDLSVILPRENVFLRGLGLNFFDYMALLTTSRGGSFSETPNGLKYHPSGNEPRMIAGSRRGIPYHSRGDNGKGGIRPPHAPLINAFRKHSDAGKAPDFLQDIWPLVSKEVETVYYLALLKRDESEQTDFQIRFLEAEPNSPEEAQVLHEFGISKEERWSWDRIQRPQGDRIFNTTTEWREWLIDYLREDAKEAALGNLNGPLKAALDVMRDLRNELRLIVDHNGLTATSHRKHLDRWYTPLNAYVSIGPPRQRIEQMIALMEAGVLEVLGPHPKVKAQDEAWLVYSPEIPGEPIRVTTLIEARLPEPTLQNTADKLLSHLYNTGQCRAHTIDAYETGGLDVTGSPYHLIDTYGRVHPKRFAVGVPTEGVHWVTAAGARPGVNSVTLCDTDAVARAALGAASIEARITRAQVEVKAFPLVEVAELRVHV